MAEINDVAAYLVSKFREGVSSMKLQKLAFLAHGWSAALRSIPLTDEVFTLWESGPVSTSLAANHKEAYTITSWHYGNSDNLTLTEKIILDAVVNQYGALTGPMLKNIVNKDAPWSDLNGTKSNLFPDEIQTHFERVLLPK